VTQLPFGSARAGNLCKHVISALGSIWGEDARCGTVRSNRNHSLLSRDKGVDMQALVTGGGGGLGKAVGKQLMARGVGTALLDASAERAHAVADELSKGSDTPVLGVGCDITSTAELNAAWEKAESTLGPIDVVVNGAGIHNPLPFIEMTDDAWEQMLAVNLTGAFKVCRRAATAWLGEGRPGSIVNVASNAALVAHPGGSSSYGASKAGLVGLTIHLAVELGPRGIRVNAIAPASFRSPMNAERLRRPGEEEKSGAMNPLGRIGEPEEIASTIIYLALDGTFINGVTVPIDGGNVIRM
jgi:NAD(P)-dependent dehydrogenase (short-subunit alcohol dehydrogenase family)